DLRIGNYLYLELSSPIADQQEVQVLNPDAVLWAEDARFAATADPLRHSPAIHVNQEGFLPAFPKKAMIGYYLGSLGELDIPAPAGFALVNAATGAQVYQGSLAARPDTGYNYTPLPYQQVWEADFSGFATPGEYRLVVPGLGASLRFRIDEGVGLAFARAYALGLYHQRCGTSNALPYTRFTHTACHTNLAEIPTMAFTNTQYFIAQASADYTNNPRHTAPQLKDVASSLYPFVNQGRINVSGGHHDAGDYSKYTINSAALAHLLMFAVDALAGVGELDNLGIPESGGGISDLMQEAKWEADFLAKMQDADGGFYFLVYPRDRKYENNVLPDQGDPQVVWPKTTAVTAAAVAALAQCASSPHFQQQYPQAAGNYLAKAKLGWQFLTNAIATHGQDGA
ncbi:MAG: glycoside hydrolase family 9 protein, partial [Pedosphaera parvula]|nr:glycoside hydrolase family 9 protein [Pedosphaera parvula]